MLTFCKWVKLSPIMKATSILFALLLSASPVFSANTNVIVISKTDKRAGAVFFMDECFMRGLTNSISLVELRKWATNTIQIYQPRMNADKAAGRKLKGSVRAQHIPRTVKEIQTRIPSCRHEETAAELRTSEGYSGFIASYAQGLGVSIEEAEARMRTLSPDDSPPRVNLLIAEDGKIEAVSISWYIYGVVVGPKSYKDDDPAWYQRKIEEGIYILHGYK